MKLLVCVDDSEMSEAALEPAAKLVDRAGAEVHLLRVLDVSHVRESTRGRMGASRRATGDWSGGNLPGAGGGFRSRKALEQRSLVESRDQAVVRVEAEARDALQGLAGRFEGGATYEVIEGGNPAEAIVDYAREYGVDFIVMATHSRTGIGRMLFGSTTSKVVAAGVAPVIVVHPSD